MGTRGRCELVTKKDLDLWVPIHKLKNIETEQSIPRPGSLGTNNWQSSQFHWQPWITGYLYKNKKVKGRAANSYLDCP